VSAVVAAAGEWRASRGAGLGALLCAAGRRASRGVLGMSAAGQEGAALRGAGKAR